MLYFLKADHQVLEWGQPDQVLFEDSCRRRKGVRSRQDSCMGGLNSYLASRMNGHVIIQYGKESKTLCAKENAC